MTRTRPGATAKNSSTQLDKSRPGMSVKGAFGVTRDRLRRPLTEPACRQVRQQSGSGEGPGEDRARSQRRGDLGDWAQDKRLTATVTATAAAIGHQQQPAAAHNTRTIRANLAYVRPEKDGRGSAPRRRDCSQDCSQAAEQHPTHVDNSGISAQPTTGDGRSWTMCPLLRIRRLGVRVPPSAPSSQARCPPGSGLFVALGATLGATGTRQPPNRARLIDSAAARLSPSSRCPYTSW